MAYIKNLPLFGNQKLGVWNKLNLKGFYGRIFCNATKMIKYTKARTKYDLLLMYINILLCRNQAFLVNWCIR